MSSSGFSLSNLTGNLPTTEIKYGDQTIKAKDLGDFKKEHPKMYALLNLLGLACSFGGKTILLDSSTRRNVKRFLTDHGVDKKAFTGHFVATVLKNFQRDAITSAMKGEEITMPKSLFDAVLQKVCRADQKTREAVEAKFTSKDGNISITHEDFLTALKNNGVKISATDKRYKDLARELQVQLKGFEPKTPAQASKQEVAKKVESEAANQLANVSKKSQDPENLVRDLVSTSGQAGLENHVQKRGMELMAFRAALSSPDLKGFSKNETAAALKWIDSMMEKGARMGELTEKDVAIMERLYQTGLKEAMAHLSPEQRNSLREAIHNVMPLVSSQPMFAIEAPPTRPAQEKKLRENILSTLDSVVKAAFEINGSDNKSVLAKSLGSGTARMGMDPMRSNENKWITQQHAMLRDEMENAKDGWFGSRRGNALGPNFLRDVIMGDPDATGSGKLGIIGLIRKGFEQLPEAERKQLKGKIDDLEGQIKRLGGHLESYAKLRAPVITKDIEFETKETYRATMSTKNITKVTERAEKTIETESVETRHRYIVARDEAVRMRNEMLVAFSEMKSDGSEAPWDLLNDANVRLLSDIAEDTDNQIKQLVIDDDVLKEAMDEGLEAAGFTTIAQFEEGATPNWPKDFRDAFVRYETKMNELGAMVEKLVPSQSSRLERTQSQIFRREDIEAGGKPRSKEEGSTVTDRTSLDSLNERAQFAIDARKKERKAEGKAPKLSRQEAEAGPAAVRRIRAKPAAPKEASGVDETRNLETRERKQAIRDQIVRHYDKLNVMLAQHEDALVRSFGVFFGTKSHDNKEYMTYKNLDLTDVDDIELESVVTHYADIVEKGIQQISGGKGPYDSIRMEIRMMRQAMDTYGKL